MLNRRGCPRLWKDVHAVKSPLNQAPLRSPLYHLQFKCTPTSFEENSSFPVSSITVSYLLIITSSENEISAIWVSCHRSKLVKRHSFQQQNLYVESSDGSRANVPWQYITKSSRLSLFLKIKCLSRRALFCIRFPSIRGQSCIECPGFARGGWCY